MKYKVVIKFSELSNKRRVQKVAKMIHEQTGYCTEVEEST